jgi:hypothetical protein
MFHGSSIRSLQSAAFVAVVLQMLALLVWMLGGRHFGRGGAFFGGVLSVGALVAVAIGVVLAPVTLIGLVVAIGVEGATPFLTCVVFSRNAIRAVRQARAAGGRWDGPLLFAMGVFLATAIPLVTEFCLGSWIVWALQSLPWREYLWFRKS